MSDIGYDDSGDGFDGGVSGDAAYAPDTDWGDVESDYAAALDPQNDPTEPAPWEQPFGNDDVSTLSGMWNDGGPDGSQSDDAAWRLTDQGGSADIPILSGPAKVIPQLPSSEAPGPDIAIVPTIDATTNLSDPGVSKVLPVLPSDGADDDRMALSGSPLMRAARIGRSDVQEFSASSDGAGANGQARLSDVALKTSKPAATAGRPASTEFDPLLAQLAGGNPYAVPGFYIDANGVISKIDVHSHPFTLNGGDDPIYQRPATPDEKQQAIETLLGSDSYASGLQSPQEIDARAHATPSKPSPVASTLPTSSMMTDRGRAWLVTAEGGNSVDMTPEYARRHNIAQFDDATKTYVDSTGNLTFGYGHRITPAERNSGFVDRLRQMSVDEQQHLAQQLFDRDIQQHYQHVVQVLGQDTVDGLAPNQLDALIGSDFNGGRHSALGARMARAIRAGDFAEARNQFNAWYGSENGGPLARSRGLVRRNVEERHIWTDGDYRPRPENDPEVQAIMRTPE